MGNSCSSGQAHKDKDNVSQQSEEINCCTRRSPPYRVTKPSFDASAEPAQELLEPTPSFKDKKPQLKGPRAQIGSSVSDSISLSSPQACASPKEEVVGPPVPANVAALTEEYRSYLLGKSTGQRTRKRRAMLIYVCAADSQDCCAEKGALHCGVAARLRVRARKRGWRMHVADLHWRSPLEQQRDHRFPVLCIAELARQSELGAVVPVLFLNSNLGTPLLPHTLECADFKAALETADEENDRSLLNKWYTLDSSTTPPCYRLVRGAPARWRREMARALSVLVRTLPQEACDAYLTTVLEQEVQHTVLMSSETARRCVWVCRAGAAPDVLDGPDDHHRELQRRLANLQRDLKLYLSERNVIRASVRGRPHTNSDEEYTAGVRSALGERLDALLDGLMADSDGPAGYCGIPASLFEEISEHLSFCQKATQCTSNREITLNELKTYVQSDSSIPLVVLGGAGCGKATLLARAASLAHTWLDDLALVVRYVGLTSQSSSSHQLLKSIVDQLHVLHTGTVYRGKNEASSLSSTLARLLSAVGRCRPVLVCVGGADALRGARWLPSRLPDNVKMIVTVTEEKDEPSSSAIMAVLSSEDGPKVVRAPPVGAEEAKAVLIACAATYSKTGAASPPEAVVKAVQKCTLPLYSKILAWQISLSAETFTEQSEPETAPELVICEELESQLEQILITTEAALGAERVKACLSLLTASRRGLDDTEILDMLAHDELFRSEETYLPWAPAALLWPQLTALLAPWLRWDGRGAARWRDAALAAAATDRYLIDCNTARHTLVEYFEGAWHNDDDPKMAGRLISQENKFSDEQYNTRKLDELPFQHYHLLRENPEVFANKPYFSKLDWVHAKLAATDCGHFLEDIGLVHVDPLPEHLDILKEVFETHSYALDYDHRQFYGLLRTTIERRQREGLEIQTDIVQEWMRDVFDPPVPTFYPINEDFWKLMESREKQVSMEGFDTKPFDLIVRFDTRGKFVATVSTEREEICVWDVARCKLVRKIVGVTHPINLVPIDEYRCVVLCRRELRVYDLDQGKFVVALKGVMNQKMPFYGLHDSKHLVALSRNRMYVNLMNIETGDCVTTFKAGEDRFLNSLLVSGDGRILVCGDETQKPFPLLVWSLTSRKLLYDLRIPHHDFVTSKAAITYEGSYVCVVSRELDEPSPNFIVVYDLQSGTLFKKWKPGCDTVALAISSVDGCVVSALADTRILVWDLVTGNCRLSLSGHVCAATQLRLAKSGGLLLSADLSATDLSVRLWDLHSGKLIAVYTPPERITSCEILLGGSVLALALENHKEIVCVKLYGPTVECVKNGREMEYDEVGYGHVEYDGKTFEIKDA
ncbi:NACHT domain- and WD repeat-containing protein 1 isoform X1 [Pieris brassicae]|uniref:NACHT domain- and WD repeat-containing protein 1 isoform X1 n=1 Tax=Pieris brassicae TaxID=7116 RepID=UPI001E660397|nr:NACHT domain- and WD repeat-containing protein 1 isoform X1 [Pieris brassicae]